MPEAVAIELALSRLTSAADNADELAWAIEKAAFLDDQPGDNRQKLRGAERRRHCTSTLSAKHPA